ncbi:MAG: SDR family oxidoreductase [Gemmatales bacterium]|nr:SDR family oxidoreductase [Gemmatales bacterium]MDW8386008.1 SDR family oxidoreductase [Gemmatales bacterium]
MLLTGGYGCIGCWIAKNLLEQGKPVWVYDLKRDERRLRQVLDDEQADQVRYCQGDVTDLTAFRSALEREGITHVIHLAGLQVPICRADPILGAKVNVIGTLVVFEAVRALGPQIERLVYASSAAVYGPPESYDGIGSRGPLADDAPLKPGTHYGVFKCCNEGNARIYWLDHGLTSIGLRPWTVYGVGRDFGMTSEPTKAIKAVALGRPFRISYGGWQDMQYADDVARAFLRCLEVPYQGAGVYNLRGEVVDVATFRRTLVEVAPEAEALVTHGEKQLAIAYDLSDAAFERDIGGVVKTPLREGIRATLERFRRLQAAGRLDISDLA